MPGHDISGFSDIAGDLMDFSKEIREVAAEVEGEFADGLEETGDSMVETAQDEAPEKSGELRESIGLVKTDQIRFRFEATAEHARPIEFGSRPHKIWASDYHYLKFENKQGETIYRRFVNHPGNEENPFFVPAFNRHKDDVERNVFNNVNRLFDRKIS